MTSTDIPIRRSCQNSMPGDRVPVPGASARVLTIRAAEAPPCRGEPQRSAGELPAGDETGVGR